MRGFLTSDEDNVSRIALVRRVLMSNPGLYLTSDGLAAVTGLTRIEVQTALTGLNRQGFIRRRVANTKAGRNSGQAYSWRDRGTCPNCGRDADDRHHPDQ